MTCSATRERPTPDSSRPREYQSKLVRYHGMIHGFVRRFPFFDQGKKAIEEIGREVRAMLRS